MNAIQKAKYLLAAARVSRYTFVMPLRSMDVSIELVEGPSRTGKNVITWAIRQNGFVWTKDAGWEYEPMPSSRDEPFLKRARYKTLHIACMAALGAVENAQQKCAEMLKRQAQRGESTKRR